jgi:hypothetical protein
MKGRKFNRIWGKPWDYSYLLAIEQRKLREMANYFKRSKLTVGWERQVKECELCVKLIDIILEKDNDYRAWLHANYGGTNILELQIREQLPFHKYINVNNAHRFMTHFHEAKSNPYIYESLKVELRRQKAFYLYHKIRLYHMQSWWD